MYNVHGLASIPESVNLKLIAFFISSLFHEAPDRSCSIHVRILLLFIA